MSSVRRIDEGQPPESSYQLDVVDVGSGAKAIYDKENLDAWLQADEEHIRSLDGRWR